MGLPTTDNFTNSNNTQLTTHSAKWTLLDGDFDIQTNALSPDDPAQDNCAAYWNDDAFNDNQYAQIVYVAGDGWNYIGPVVRGSAGPDYYGYWACPNHTVVQKCVAGVFTQLGSDGAAPSATDVLRIEANGTTITPLIDSVEQDPPGAQTDAAIASGSGGVCGYWDNAGTRGDDWEAGNLGEAPVFPPVPGKVHRERRLPLVRM